MNTIAQQIQVICEAYRYTTLIALADEAIDVFRILIYPQWTSPMAIRERTFRRSRLQSSFP